MSFSFVIVKMFIKFYIILLKHKGATLSKPRIGEKRCNSSASGDVYSVRRVQPAASVGRQPFSSGSLRPHGIAAAGRWTWRSFAITRTPSPLAHGWGSSRKQNSVDDKDEQSYNEVRGLPGVLHWSDGQALNLLANAREDRNTPIHIRG